MFVVCILAVCFFEAINGFHDTANAVATVIYTKTLPPVFAVIWSGIWNFIGAMFGGIGVAMGMIKLMPLNDMMATTVGENIALVLAILVTAIAWNLGTWYFGIPCSSSHTMIGALLGGGFAFYNVHGGAGPNWDKAKDVGLALFTSPLVGFFMAVCLMYLLRTLVKKKTIFKSPEDTKKAPPPWIRAILVGTCTLVSYFHGNNDGQKGVGLLIVVLIAFMPMHFALNPNMPIADMRQNVTVMDSVLTRYGGDHPESSLALASQARKLGAQLDSLDKNDKNAVFAVRKNIQALNKKLDSAVEDGTLTGDAAAAIKAEKKKLAGAYEYRIFWAVLLISLCLGVGTMIGWKRIVVTIGEKIGKTHLSYAQGASAELCAAITIGVNSYYALPVSTTHILSSGIAGTMVSEGGVKNLRRKTITNIALAWILTLPVTFAAAFLLFFVFRAIG
jgi:PiT family inorganic phosphate transporter